MACRFKCVFPLAVSLMVFAPFHARAAQDLHDLYNALQRRGHAVTIPAKVLVRLKLGSPSSDVTGKEITVTEKDRDRRGVTAFELAGIPTITMFHTEMNKDDAWLVRFTLDGRILNQEWEQGGYRTFEISSVQVAESEIAFWRRWMAAGSGK